MTSKADRYPAPPAPPEARDYNALPHGTFADEVDEDALLARAAEILQRRSTAMPEPDPIPPKSIPEGGSILIHVLDGFSLDGWRSDRHARGEEITISYDDVAGQDWSDHRTGENKFDRLLAEGRTIAKGPWPRWMRTWSFGDTNWEDARRAAVAEASRERDVDARADAMREVVEKFGPSSFTPTTAAKYYAKIYADPAAHKFAKEARA